MKKILLIFGLLIVASTIAIAVFKSQKQKIEQEARLEPRELHVEFRENGRVYPRNRLAITPQFPGRIEEILVEEGDAIRKGQIIVWMSSRERASLIDAAMAISEKEHQRWQNIYKPAPIVASMDGFIIARNKEPGQIVSSSDTILAMADDLIVFADIDETDLSRIEIGLKLRMYLDAYPAERFEGVVEHIYHESTSVNNVTVYTIRIKPLEKPKVFRAGMSVIITITAESKKDAMSIPSIFVTEKEQAKTVTIKTGTAKKPIFEIREVTTGITDGKFTEIVSGLNASETVVILSQKPKAKSKAEK
ncbi:MAG: efflux RND transporter periplasmic adaptor subunit [Endomicrobium sp.]|uniref:efflux RND transporter periplasmic adaptor subunit n=1 Tax=Candidatus Endomicrobiellum pyrsonymphae TaxID=1408203 RepID=UPI0035856CBC|nr:efflux RND transporter periplasmic adaptor subunit [Endomicrobium sp.]